MPRPTTIAAIVIGVLVLFAGGVITGVLVDDAGTTGSGTTQVQISEAEPKADKPRDRPRRRPRPPSNHRIGRLLGPAAEQEGPQGPKAEAKPREQVEITKLETRTTESNESYHRISYIVSVRNNTWETIEGWSLYVDFLDAAGFVLESWMDYPVRLQPGDNTLRGLALLDSPLALQTATIEARVQAD